MNNQEEICGPLKQAEIMRKRDWLEHKCCKVWVPDGEEIQRCERDVVLDSDYCEFHIIGGIK